MAERNQPVFKGETAPDFTLKDQSGKAFELSRQKGKRVLLSFQPLAWTPVCQNQMKGLEEHFDEITALNTVPVGLSMDSWQSKKAWAQSLGIQKLACWRISGRTAGWRKLTGFSGRQKVYRSGPTSSSMRTAKSPG